MCNGGWKYCDGTQCDKYLTENETIITPNWIFKKIREGTGRQGMYWNGHQ